MGVGDPGRARESGDLHVAQLNVARLRAPLDSPELADFVASLDPINALADRAPGFVWRLQTEEGDATSVRIDGDDAVIVNMSVWESVEALADFTYRSQHRDVMARRGQWFERFGQPYLVLWWVERGHIPTLEEALARLATLRAHGPGPEAFTFRWITSQGGPSAGAGS